MQTNKLKLLSRRHRQIALLLVGRQNKDAAAELGLSPFTITHHLHIIYARTGLSRTELVVEAERYRVEQSNQPNAPIS